MSLLDIIPGYREAAARETIGRDAAYLRQPKLVAGIALRPLTLRDYLRLSAESSPFVAGGIPGRDDACFLLWHQQAHPREGVEPKEFAGQFDVLPIALLQASCAVFVGEAMADFMSGGSGRRASYYGFGAAVIHALRAEYKCGREEILDSPMDELAQEMRAIQLRLDPRAVLFNRSDRIKGQWLRERSDKARGVKESAKRRPQRKRPK